MAAVITLPIRKPKSLINKIKIAITLKKLKKIKGLTIGKNLKINKTPIIDIRNNGRIVIGDNVTLNSENTGYHANMHSRVKLYADRPEAEIYIGNNTRIHGTCIHAYGKIHIGNNCLLAANTQIMDCNGHELSFDNPSNRINTTSGFKPIVIHDNVWIGLNSIILPGVTIGEGSVIAAGSVVTKDISPMVIAGGNPAKVIKKYYKDELGLLEDNDDAPVSDEDTR